MIPLINVLNFRFVRLLYVFGGKHILDSHSATQDAQVFNTNFILWVEVGDHACLDAEF